MQKVGPLTRGFTIALLAQIMLCLVAAPILLARQWSEPNTKQGSNAPADSRISLQAALDASNIRPEEVSDAEQKKGKRQSPVHAGLDDRYM